MTRRSWWRVIMEAMMSSGDDPVLVGPALVIGETSKALKVSVKENCLIPPGIHWVMKTGIHDDSEVWKRGQEGDLVVKQWCAEIKRWL